MGRSRHRYRNTVERGPERDLIGAIADAVRSNGMRFGVYYSGGLDWHVVGLAHRTPRMSKCTSLRPNDAAYDSYAAAHVRRPHRRYQPESLGRPEWSRRRKHSAPGGLARTVRCLRRRQPDGVVNDRCGHTSHDFVTSEYSAFSDNENENVWENYRGIGFSFAYNRNESTDEILSTMQLAKHWVGVVGKGGRLLINVGPTAEGIIPDLQRQTLEGFGDWKAPLAEAAASVVERTPSSTLAKDGEGTG